MKNLFKIDKEIQRHIMRSFNPIKKDQSLKDYTAVKHIKAIDTMHRINKKMRSV